MCPSVDRVRYIVGNSKGIRSESGCEGASLTIRPYRNLPLLFASDLVVLLDELYRTISHLPLRRAFGFHERR